MLKMKEALEIQQLKQDKILATKAPVQILTQILWSQNQLTVTGKKFYRHPHPRVAPESQMRSSNIRLFHL